jgi:prepilin-type N-terminal cleavage/methylation domain-containing protein
VTSKRQAGFSLIEVMAALMLLAVTLVTMLQLRDAAIARAANSRSLALASRLGARMIHQIEAARIPDMFDGMQGDFSEDGEGDLLWVIGIGDGSAFSGSQATSDAEDTWRDLKEDSYEDLEEEERPEFTRIFVTVSWDGWTGDQRAYTLETLLPSWAVYQDFDAWRQVWGSNQVEGIQ